MSDSPWKRLPRWVDPAPEATKLWRDQAENEARTFRDEWQSTGAMRYLATLHDKPYGGRVLNGDYPFAELTGDELAEAVRILGPLPDLTWMPAGDVTVTARHGWRLADPWPWGTMRISGWVVSVVAPGVERRFPVEP